MPITPTPKIWMNGSLVEWDQAQVHILTHTLHYGTGVFEGIRAYETADGKWLAVGGMEAHFYADLLDILELDPATLPDQNDRAQWPRMKQVFADAVRARTREEWVTRAAGRGCVSPVLEVEEAWVDPHNVARGTFVEVAGVVQPAPQPRFSHTPARIDGPPPAPGEHTREALAAWGIATDRIDAWEAAGAIAQTTSDNPQKGSRAR